MKNTSITHETYALHSIQNETDFTFDPKEYSRFKYGDKSIARKYGYALANGLTKSGIEFFSNQQIVVVSSPYAHIPTATFAMKDYFVHKLNSWLVSFDFPVVQETKIHRTVTYNEDYGNMDAKQRMNLIGKDQFHIDREFVKGKTVLFLDDVYITGSHEKVVRRMIESYDLDCRCIFLYFGKLVNPDCCPKLEGMLNNFYVKKLIDLNDIIQNEDFIPNTRVVKFMLNAPHEEFQSFIQYQSKQFRSTIYHLALGNSYHLIPDYMKNLFFLKKLLPKN